MRGRSSRATDLAVLRLACAVSTIALVAACAAFPLEPDLSRLDGGPNAQSRYVVFTSKRAKPETESDDRDEANPEPEEPAR